MAVIINNVDMPKSCFKCGLRYKDDEIWRCKITEEKIDYLVGTYNKRDMDCPLKSTDEMCNEIQNIYVGYRHGYEVMADVMDIINKYCKENT